ncbi:MAG TPA: 30S ribosomal protein S20 [Candidatus Hydrogenedens sp.]|nr:30S ribosomal protein S20 [Candidatus Hydrogenedens sp.]HOK08101.1 30S ribosomal protein S20 [Candidatus Hydrogenedens sp.]HOL20483.1 30S ribosomal protein S20 [Candidatus Hydrogenedens sp.]HPP57905.1 30S ribosomal protein S20 [Candidatus Hydrogenedens sp.]
MANIKSQKKRIKTNEQRRLKNTSIRSRMKTMVKKAIQSVNNADDKTRQSAILEAISTIDRACAKGVIHRNSAARRKSRLMKRINKALTVN